MCCRDFVTHFLPVCVELRLLLCNFISFWKEMLPLSFIKPIFDEKTYLYHPILCIFYYIQRYKTDHQMTGFSKTEFTQYVYGHGRRNWRNIQFEGTKGILSIRLIRYLYKSPFWVVTSWKFHATQLRISRATFRRPIRTIVRTILKYIHDYAILRVVNCTIKDITDKTCQWFYHPYACYAIKAQF